mgnify:CR=1 FL=1
MVPLSSETSLPSHADLEEAHDDAHLLVEKTRKLAELNQWFELALNNMARGLSMFDAEKRLVVCNALYRQIYDLPEHITAPGTPLSKIIAYHTARGGANTAEELMKQQLWIEHHARELSHGKTFTHQQQLPNGRIILVTNQPLSDGGWVDIQEDITERTMAEERISWLARHCPLTEIANRFHLQERLTSEIQRLRPNERLAIHIVDLDYFKQVNDTLGHATGDAVLKAVAKRMTTTVRDTDFVGRLGGDEFAIIQKEIVDIHQSESLAERLVKVLNAPYRILGSSAGIGASIGIALCPDHGKDADRLLQRADTALYRVKSSGRGGFAIYQPQDETVARERIALQTDLREAVKRNHIALYYQPMVDVDAGTVTGCEALMRWRHPKLGMLPPSTFLPIAEKAGLMATMGDWAIRQACQDAARWTANVKVAVNLAAIQFDQGDLAKTVEAALEASGLEASRLELEITEKILLQRETKTFETLQRLRNLGVRLVLDDFGTSFASLGYLRNFSFDKIKIDRSLTAGLSGRRDRMAIVGAAAGLARALGIGPVAEGIEGLDQIEGMSEVGCQEMQGFYFSHPVPSVEVDQAVTECLVKLEKAPAA